MSEIKLSFLWISWLSSKMCPCVSVFLLQIIHFPLVWLFILFLFVYWASLCVPLRWCLLVIWPFFGDIGPFVLGFSRPVCYLVGISLSIFLRFICNVSYEGLVRFFSMWSFLLLPLFTAHAIFCDFFAVCYGVGLLFPFSFDVYFLYFIS